MAAPSRLERYSTNSNPLLINPGYAPDTMLRYLPRVACLTVCMPSPYSSISREKKNVSYVLLIEFGWNGLKVSEVDNLENRKFLEAIASPLNL